MAAPDDNEEWLFFCCRNRFILCEEVDEVYQSLDDTDADDSLAMEAAQRRRDWLSQIDFNKYAFHPT